MTKIASPVNTVNDVRSMQRTLKKITLANRWDMKFNVNNCGVMHIEKINLEFVPEE